MFCRLYNKKGRKCADIDKKGRKCADRGDIDKKGRNVLKKHTARTVRGDIDQRKVES